MDLRWTIDSKRTNKRPDQAWKLTESSYEFQIDHFQLSNSHRHCVIHNLKTGNQKNPEHERSVNACTGSRTFESGLATRTRTQPINYQVRAWPEPLPRNEKKKPLARNASCFLMPVPNVHSHGSDKLAKRGNVVYAQRNRLITRYHRRDAWQITKNQLRTGKFVGEERGSAQTRWVFIGTEEGARSIRDPRQSICRRSPEALHSSPSMSRLPDKRSSRHHLHSSWRRIWNEILVKTYCRDNPSMLRWRQAVQPNGKRTAVGDIGDD
ncbi:hypothetical protein DFH11DRAFT_429670 [Phellopilus nigrolimitatus]|nr:hypothetical protein DFH11DRAFT_429670 [Phellopilus nigrolimitatus]